MLLTIIGLTAGHWFPAYDLSPDFSHMEPIGVQAIKWAEANNRGKLQPIEERTDARGATWCLFHSGALGDDRDLWLGQKVNGRWQQAWFLGVRDELTNTPDLFDHHSPGEIFNMDWVQFLVDNPLLTRDSDNDGFTDIVEARLGLDPHNPDCDGDGIPDGSDSWPNAPSRPLNDKEQVVAAAFLITFRDGEPVSSPLVSTFECGGCDKPFAVPRSKGLFIWKKPDAPKLPLEEGFGHGYVRLRTWASNNRPGVFSWSDDHKIAWVTTYWSGDRLAAEDNAIGLMKIGGRWTVVSKILTGMA